MTSAISQSSVGTVIEDLVSDRSIPFKVCMIILNVAQLVSCWITVGYFIKYYEIWSLLELTLSLVLLLSGNYLIPCIANAVIYGRRWKRSSVSNRRKIEEENKQAWVCLRIALSLCGVPTVGRYIETIIVSNKLRILEKKHIKESVVAHKEGSQLNPIGTSRIGSTVNQLKSGIIQRNNSVISGMSQASSTGIPESSQRKVRKARRQYKRCEHDGSLMALIAGSAGAGPMAIGLGFLYFHREDMHAMKTDQMTVICISFALNLLWLAASLTHFYPARHVLSEAEFERGIRPSHVMALLLLYMSHLIQVTLRVICLVIFVSWFYGYVCIPIVFHWLLCTFLLVGYRAYMQSHTVGRPISERARRATTSFLSALFFGYVGIFDFVNGNMGKTRVRYLIYYIFYYLENVAMLVIWILRNPTTQIRYPIPFVFVVLGLFWLGFLFLQLYLYYYSYSPYGSSIIGLCKKKSKSRGGMNYVTEVREPVFGVPVAQSAVPFWRQSSHGDNGGSRLSGVSGAGRGSKIGQQRSLVASSISQSHQPTASIFSELSSQINNPIMIRPPPVIAQRLRQQQDALKRPMKIDDDDDNDGGSLASDSSSSTDDELQIYSPRSRSEPHLVSRGPLSSECSGPSLSGVSHSHSTCMSQSVLTDAGQYKAAHIHHAPLVPVAAITTSARTQAQSLKSISVVAPPRNTTKRIGPVSEAPQTAAIRPLPSMDQMRRLRQTRSISGGHRH